jgi:hypothetical protein
LLPLANVEENSELEEEDWEEVPEHRVLPHGWIPERIHLLFRLCRLLSPFVLFDFHEA